MGVIVGGLNGSNVGTNATAGWALKPDFSSVSSHIHLTWAVACFFGLSCLFHLGNATFLKKFYLAALEKGYAPFRWIEYSMSASVMILFFAWGLVVAQFMEAGGSSTTDSQGEKSQMPTFVYGIVFGELLIFWGFGLMQLIVSLRPPAKYYQGEIAYMWLSLFAKGVLGLLVLSNVLVLGSFTDIYA